jgi:hypothetical protein
LKGEERKAAMTTYIQQKRRHDIWDGILHSTSRGIRQSYEVSPVTVDDIERLEAQLLLYVSDAKTRQDLMNAAKTAAGKTQGSETQPDSESK